MEDWNELEAILARYDLGALETCRRVDHGYVNETWIVTTTTGQYVLRRRHPFLSSPLLIEGQHALVRYLVDAGFPAPEILSNRHDGTFVEQYGQLYEVQQYVSGSLCDAADPAHVSSAARVLGQYHTVVAGFDHAALHPLRERYSALTLALTVRCLKREWQGKVNAQVRRLYSPLDAHVAELEAVFHGFEGLPRLVIHGDYYAENLIFVGDMVAGVVDYDQAHWCWRALEVAEALIYFAKESKEHLEHIVYSGALDLGAVERFWAAYGAVIHLSDAEIRALPHLVRTIWMCAALDPPLLKRPSALAAEQVLPEVLYLADWAQAHAAEITDIGFETRRR